MGSTTTNRNNPSYCCNTQGAKVGTAHRILCCFGNTYLDSWAMQQQIETIQVAVAPPKEPRQVQFISIPCSCLYTYLGSLGSATRNRNNSSCCCTTEGTKASSVYIYQCTCCYTYLGSLGITRTNKKNPSSCCNTQEAKVGTAHRIICFFSFNYLGSFDSATRNRNNTNCGCTTQRAKVSINS